MITQQINHILHILQVWTMHIQLDLFNEPFKNYATAIMWAHLMMATTKEIPQPLVIWR
jgi:hypothetical protein